jgi:hypothetical protein
MDWRSDLVGSADLADLRGLRDNTLESIRR